MTESDFCITLLWLESEKHACNISYENISALIKVFDVTAKSMGFADHRSAYDVLKAKAKRGEIDITRLSDDNNLKQ